jgi:hypothetical protein
MPNQRAGWKPPGQEAPDNRLRRKLAQPDGGIWHRDVPTQARSACGSRQKPRFLPAAPDRGRTPRIRLSRLGWKTGFEPATLGITIRCSNRLSYIHHRASWPGAPGGSRTPNRRSRSPMLYPVELRALDRNCAPGRPGPPNENRVAAGMVGVEGFEPPTSCSQSRRATRLRYTPSAWTSSDPPPGPSAGRAQSTTGLRGDGKAPFTDPALLLHR